MKENIQGIDDLKKGIKNILLDTTLKNEYEQSLNREN